MCSLTIECVLLLWNVFSYYRMCSLTIECVLLLSNVFSYYRMCSLTVECVLLLSNVFSYYRMCSLTTKCVLLLSNVFSYYRMCSLSIEFVLLLWMRCRDFGCLFACPGYVLVYPICPYNVPIMSEISYVLRMSRICPSVPNMCHKLF
jgi:hypothetical protein